MTPPVLWVLVIAPALADALGGFSSDVDYYTFVAVSQAALHRAVHVDVQRHQRDR